MRPRFALGVLIAASFAFELSLGRSYAQDSARGGGLLMKKPGDPKAKPQAITPETVAAEIYLRPEMKARLLEAARTYLNKPETAEKIQNLVWEKQTDLIVPIFRSNDPKAKPALDPGALLMPVDERGEPLGTESALAVQVPASSVLFDMKVESIQHSQNPGRPASLVIEAQLDSAVIELQKVDVGVAYGNAGALNGFRALPVSVQGTPVDSISAQVRVDRPVVRFEVWLPPNGLDVEVKHLEVQIPPGGVHPEIRGLPDRIQLGTPEGGKIAVSLPPSAQAKIRHDLEGKVAQALESAAADPELREKAFSAAEITATQTAQAALKDLEFPIPLNIRKKVSASEVPLVIAQELNSVRAWDKRPMLLRPLAKRVALEGLTGLAQDMAGDLLELPAADPASNALTLLAEELRRYFLGRFPQLAQKLARWVDAKSIFGGDGALVPGNAAAFLTDLAEVLEKEKDSLNIESRDFRMIQKVSVLRNRFLGPEVTVKLSSESRLRDSTVTANIFTKGLNTKMLRGNITCPSGVAADRKTSQVRLSLDASNELFRQLYEEDPNVYNDLIPGGFKFLKAPVLTGVPGTSKVRLIVYGEQPGTDLGGIREDAKLTFEIEGEVQPSVDGTGLRVEALKLIRASEKRFTIERLGNPVNWFATQIFNFGSFASTGLARGQFKKAQPSLRKEIELDVLKRSGGRISSVTFNQNNQMEVTIAGEEGKP